MQADCSGRLLRLETSARRLYEDMIGEVFDSDVSGEEKSRKYWEYQVGMQTISDDQSPPDTSAEALPAGFLEMRPGIWS